MLFVKRALFVKFLKSSKFYVYFIVNSTYCAVHLCEAYRTGSDFYDLYVVLLINRIRRLDRNVLKNI